jgi:hypothetical protein
MYIVVVAVVGAAREAAVESKVVLYVEEATVIAAETGAAAEP